MITTICMNPSFDRTVEVDALAPGHVNRVRTSRTDVGGKGVNVAVVARRLGLEAQVIGCAGTDGIDRVRAAMEAEGVGHAFLEVKGAVRVNTKVVALDGSGVTEFNEPGPALTEDDLQRFFALAKEKCAGSDFVVITGSLPPGCPAGTYRELIRALPDTRVILDVGGTELLLGAQAHPFMIKPNHHELAATLGRELHTLEDIRAAAQVFIDGGVTHVVTSLGGDGALYAGADGTLLAPAVEVEVHSTVGAGDAMVGGLLTGFLQDGKARTALRCGAAAGTASVMTEGTQLIVPEDYERLLPQVQIQDM